MVKISDKLEKKFLLAKAIINIFIHFVVFLPFIVNIDLFYI